MDSNTDSDVDSSGWEADDFINKYTTKSAMIACSPRIDEFAHHNNDSRIHGIDSVDGKMEERFCTRENIENRLLYLNQEMGMLGFPSIFSKPVNADGKSSVMASFDPIQLINCTHELVKMQQQSMKRRNDMEERQMRSDSDYEALLQNQTRLKQDLETTKREECLLKLKEAQLQDKVKKLQTELKNEKEEVKKMKNDQQHKYKQFIHEAKRKEKETLRLRDRIHQLLTDNKTEKSKGIIISNTLSRADGKRGTWKGVNRDGDDMYKVMMAKYDERHQELITENTHLREYLAELLNDYIAVLKEQYSEDEDKEPDSKREEPKPKLHRGHFAMPFHLVKEDIHSNFQAAFQALRERLEQGSSKGSTPANRSPQSDEEKDQLKLELQSCRDVICKQDQLLQEMQEKLLNSPYDKEDELSPREVEHLKDRLRMLNEEKENLRSNRKKYTDLAVNLAQEREAFEREKIEFYRSCLSTPMLAAATSREQNKGNSGGTGKRMLPTLKSSTPVFSPAPRDTNNNSNNSTRGNQPTPSTTELYRFMSLIAEGSDLSKGGVDQVYDDDMTNDFLRRRKSSSARSRSGAYEGQCASPVNTILLESPLSHRSKRVSEHAQMVKQAMENHHRSMEETSPRPQAAEAQG